jgi:hypothetical protein
MVSIWQILGGTLHYEYRDGSSCLCRIYQSWVGMTNCCLILDSNCIYPAESCQKICKTPSIAILSQPGVDALDVHPGLQGLELLYGQPREYIKS